MDGCGDSALPLLAVREIAGNHFPGVLLIECDALNVENLLDFADTRLALMVIAAGELAGELQLHELSAAETAAPASLNGPLSPAQLLHMLQTIERHRDVPPGFVLTLRGEDFRAGDRPTATGEQSLRAGVALLRELLETPDVGTWRRHAD
jgi:hypothetical protein